MNRRRLIILLSVALYVTQVAIIAYWHSLAPANERMKDMFVAVFAMVAITLISAGVTQYFLHALRRAEVSYENDISRQLERCLEEYRTETLRENQIVLEIGTSIQEELGKAREALATGEYDKMDDHLRSSLEFASRANKPYCDNVAVSAVLENKARECAEKGVQLNTHVSLPEDLALQDVEVAALFFNLIDNALSECEVLSSPGKVENPAITVRSKIQAGQLFVQVANPCRTGVEARRQAAIRSSDISQAHGWGSSIVTGIAQRNHGIAEFEEKRDTFTASVMIPLPSR